MHPQRAHFFSAASAPTPLRLDGVSFRYDSTYSECDAFRRVVAATFGRRRE